MIPHLSLGESVLKNIQRVKMVSTLTRVCHLERHVATNKRIVWDFRFETNSDCLMILCGIVMTYLVLPQTCTTTRIGPFIA